MQVIFLGDPRDSRSGPDAITLYGITFPKSEAVDVTDPAVLGKLMGNGHFAVEQAPAPVPVQPQPKRRGRRRGYVHKD